LLRSIIRMVQIARVDQIIKIIGEVSDGRVGKLGLCLVLGIIFIVVAIAHFVFGSIFYSSSFEIEVDCINTSTAHPSEQFICAVGKETTLKIERERPSDIRIYVAKNNTLPPKHDFDKYTYFGGWIDSEYWQYFCNVLESSVIYYNCTDDIGTLEWYILDNKNMDYFRRHEGFTSLVNGTSPFKGTFIVPASGQYHIVVKGHGGSGFSALFKVNVTFKLYDTSSFDRQLSCQETNCSLHVAADEVVVLDSTGGMSDIRVHYTSGYNTQVLGIYISVGALFFVFGLIFFFVFAVLKSRKKEEGEGREEEPLLHHDETAEEK